MPESLTPDQRLVHVLTASAALASQTRDSLDHETKRAQALAAVLPLAVDQLLSLDETAAKQAAAGDAAYAAVRQRAEGLLSDHVAALQLFNKVAGLLLAAQQDAPIPTLGKLAGDPAPKTASSRDTMTAAERVFVDAANGIH